MAYNLEETKRLVGVQRVISGEPLDEGNKGCNPLPYEGQGIPPGGLGVFVFKVGGTSYKFPYILLDF